MAGRSRQNLKVGTEPAPLPEPVIVVVEDGVPQQLAEMRHVLVHRAAAGEAESVKAIRRWLKEDIKAFMGAKTKLEDAVIASRKPVTKDGPAEEDRGSEACEEMYERLLEEWGEELR